MLYYTNTCMYKITIFSQLASVHLLYFPALKQVVETNTPNKERLIYQFNNNNNGNTTILSNLQLVFNRSPMFWHQSQMLFTNPDKLYISLSISSATGWWQMFDTSPTIFSEMKSPFSLRSLSIECALEHTLAIWN